MCLPHRVITYDVWFAAGRGELGRSSIWNMDPTLFYSTLPVFLSFFIPRRLVTTKSLVMADKASKCVRSCLSSASASHSGTTHSLFSVEAQRVCTMTCIAIELPSDDGCTNESVAND